MSDNIDTNDGAGDADFEQFAEGVLEEFNGLSAEEQAEAIVGMAAENLEYEDAVEDAAEVIKSLTENTVPKEKFDELKKSAALLYDRVTKSGSVQDEDGLLADIRKSLAPGQELSPEAEARITEVEKSLARQAAAEAVVKAKAYGFGKADEVAGLETRIRKALGDKDADAFAGIVKQAGALAKVSKAFQPIGEDAGADAGEQTPVTKMKTAAAEIRKAKPALTEQQAMSEAIDANPELYSEYEKSLRATGRAA